MRIFYRAALAAVLASTALVAMASSKTIEVSQQELGSDWPFNAEKATLSCFKGLLPVATINGKKYGLTGMAKSMGHIPLTPDTPIWRDNPETGAKVSLYRISEKARGLCN